MNPLQRLLAQQQQQTLEEQMLREQAARRAAAASINDAAIQAQKLKMGDDPTGLGRRMAALGPVEAVDPEAVYRQQRAESYDDTRSRLEGMAADGRIKDGVWTNPKTGAQLEITKTKGSGGNPGYKATMVGQADGPKRAAGPVGPALNVDEDGNENAADAAGAVKANKDADKKAKQAERVKKKLELFNPQEAARREQVEILKRVAAGENVPAATAINALVHAGGVPARAAAEMVAMQQQAAGQKMQFDARAEDRKLSQQAMSDDADYRDRDLALREKALGWQQSEASSDAMARSAALRQKQLNDAMQLVMENPQALSNPTIKSYIDEALKGAGIDVAGMPKPTEYAPGLEPVKPDGVPKTPQQQAADLATAVKLGNVTPEQARAMAQGYDQDVGSRMPLTQKRTLAVALLEQELEKLQPGYVTPFMQGVNDFTQTPVGSGLMDFFQTMGAGSDTMFNKYKL